MSYLHHSYFRSVLPAMVGDRHIELTNIYDAISHCYASHILLVVGTVCTAIVTDNTSASRVAGIVGTA